MAQRESRKRKLVPEAEEYKKELAAKEHRVKRMRESREIGKEVNTELADLFGKMSAKAPEAAAMDVEMDMAARGRRRRKTRKSSKKKSRKTRKH